MAEFINLFAGQIKQYNEIAPSLWPDNAVHNQSVIAECIENGSFWLISPDGNITMLSKKEALATYEDYKVQFPDDYANSQYFDRMEGTAHYFEIGACLYAAYPSKIKNENDLHRAWSLLATRSDYIDKVAADIGADTTDGRINLFKMIYQFMF